MANPAWGIVLFDFDYTLADSSQGVVDCVTFALRQLNLPNVSDASIHRTIGLSLFDTLYVLTGQKSREQSEKFAQLFVQRADHVMAKRTVLFRTVPSTLEVLRNHGIRLGIVSTKFRYRIESILQRENVLRAFDIIIGGEDVHVHKPDPRGLLTAMRELGGSPSNTLYVGDSVTDAETAKRAGIPFVAVLSGVTLKEDFDQYEVCGVLDCLSELPGLILKEWNS
jgi:phosphoglycolate phosphatase